MMRTYSLYVEHPKLINVEIIGETLEWSVNLHISHYVDLDFSWSHNNNVIVHNLLYLKFHT